MAPRKKACLSSLSKKSIQQSQPSKFGIQHFFERHTQNALLASQNRSSASDAAPSSPPKSKPGNGSSHVTTSSNSGEPTSNSVVLPPLKPKNGSNDINGASQNTPPGDLMPVDTDAQVSPEMSKSVPRKRFKFSPGMLVKQSQDDGGDDVTWRISPVNERLQAVSKRMPEVIKVLADSSRHNSFNIMQCSQTKVDKMLSSPPTKASEASFVSGSRVGLKRVNPFHDPELDAEKNICLASRESPFRTPPSLSYCNNKVSNGVACDEAPDQLGSREHKKTLLELLDQVEGAISAEDSVSDELEQLSTKVKDKCSFEATSSDDGILREVRVDVKNEVVKNFSDGSFLVLEVSEKHETPKGSCAQHMYKVLRLVNEQTAEERAVNLWDEWFYSVVAPGDTVNVIGAFDETGKCNVNCDNNFLIVHPDILISGTRVAASFSCSRRTVLDERLRSCEHSTYALIGTLLHQIFQAGLLHESPTVQFLEEYTRIVLQRNMESLYACGVNESEMYKTLIEAIPKIVNWAILFKDSQDTEGTIIDFGSDNGHKKVKISEVLDIEEMAWAPKYGLKGMVDASIKVKVDSGESKADERIIPLEFKTGKVPNGQSSVEHCAQVILYTILMSERYLKHIDFGLLYYLQSDQTQGIAVRRSDLVGLIMRRNELASDILRASTMQQLPPMLQIPSVCKGCRHLDVCSIFHKALGGDVETSGLGDLFDTKIQQLSDVHFAFLRHWDWLIDLEAKEMQLMKKDIWKSHNVKDGHLKNYLSSLVLDKPSNQKRDEDNRFVYRFVCKSFPVHKSKESDSDYSRSASSPVDDLDCALKNGDYVILSTESSDQIIASGSITDISPDHVSVSLSKRLRIPGSTGFESHDMFKVLWRISKDEIMTSFPTMRFNLMQLFLQNDQSSRLRKMVVDLEAPRFDSGCLFSQDPAVSYVWSQSCLNEDQRRAILKILAAKDYALILGMPGTGKTSTMVHAVKALLMRGATILLTSYTNSAVDNLLIKLKAQDIDFIRIGRYESVHEEVKGHCFSAMNMQSVEDIRSRLDQVKVVAVTCLGISSPLLSGKRFDICVMDEAGQTTLPVSLGPLMFASVFVLVGDHYQLPPLVKSTEARENGLGVSLFCRLSEAHPQAISPLQSQYRMCQGIMDLSNALIYDNRLRCGSSEIATAKLNFTKSMHLCSPWLKDALNPSRPVIFVNTDLLPAFEERDHKTVNNPKEASIIADITEGLVSNGIQGKDIGIITPYNSQAGLLRTICAESVEIHTIDKYQGRDKDCILISFVRSSENPRRNCASTLIGDWHRINVALTRAKKKLIMVGSCATLSKVPLLNLLIDKVKEQSGVVIFSKEDINKGHLRRCSQIR